MELWNDFEGKVVDDRFRLGRLLAPKGRSAFFLATTLSGEPIMMRVIESLNDEEEILARWRVVEGIHEENLQRIAASGKTVLDGTHLVYAVLEPTEASLDEVLRDRPLTAEETRQMASAVVAGLESLHRAGMVHEHVDAGNVLARGETVKLRSDCVREAPEGAEGEALRRKDAHDLAVLVGYALTQRRDASQAALPRQFEDLVRNGTSGIWGMKEMSALLRPAAATVLQPVSTGAKGVTGPTLVDRPGAGASGTAGTGNGTSGNGVGSNGGGAVRVSKPATAVAANGRETAGAVPVTAGPVSPAMRPGTAAAAARPVGGATGGGVTRSTSAAAVASALLEEEGAAAEPERAGVGIGRAVVEPEEAPHTFSAKPWIAAGVAALVLLLLIWHFAGRGSKTPVAVTPTPTPTTAPATESAGAVTPAMKPSAGTGDRTASTANRAPAGAMMAGPGLGNSTETASSGAAGTGTWRVITYTFMRREQAQHRADAIAARHPELRPEVLAPGGRAPFLVALGDGMTEREAIGLRARALHDGMPRDTFARNYRGR